VSVCFSGILNSSTNDFAQRPPFLLGLQPLDANNSAGTKPFFALFYTQLSLTLFSVTNTPILGLIDRLNPHVRAEILYVHYA